MIYLPPPQPVLNKDIRISGDVEIHPTASLAPGVILQAAPNCRIEIGADVCIGMGVIVNAGQGSVEIGSGAILGSGVLIIGSCKIGNNACLGTAVTVFQTDVNAMTVIEPGSILGDNSRKLKLEAPTEEKSPDIKNSSSEPSQVKSSQNGKGKVKPNAVSNHNFSTSKTTIENPQPKQNSTSTSTQTTSVPSDPKNKKDAVVGQVYINQLLVTLFPNNKEFNSDNRKLE